MSQAPSVAVAGIHEDSVVEAAANVTLRGTSRGLEVLISGTPSAAALGARLTELLAEAPSFFAGCDARIAIDGVLPVGSLACLEDVATRFELRIVEIGPVARRGRIEVAGAPRATAPGFRRSEPKAAKLAEGTGRISEDPAELRGDDPRAIPIPPLPSALRTSGEAVTGAGPTESGPSAVPHQTAGAAASDALVSAATALVSAATALTCEPAASGATSGSGAASVAVPAADASGKAASKDTSSDAAGKAASKDTSSDAAGKAASKDAPTDAACKAAPAGVAQVGKPAAAGAGDSAVAVALQAVLTAANASDRHELLVETPPGGPRLVIGPVRSGRIVDHAGHLVVIGDVNPGAEVRAEGSIIVLGRLRGVAHAAIGRDAGCIIALSLQPQQLRIGRMVARAGDADRPSGGAEIAYATGETIVVERFNGRLPSGLAASM